MSDNLRQRRFGSACHGDRGVAHWPVPFVLLVVFGSACARFGFDLLDRAPDSGIDGPRLTSTSGAGGAIYTGTDSGPPGAAGSGSNAAGSGASPGAAGAGPTDSDAGPGGAGAGGSGSNCSLCDCSVDPPERLSDPSFPDSDLWSPALSRDGLSLYFGVTVLGSTEQIARSARSDRSASFGPGQLLPAPVNQGTEGSPYLSSDALSLYFYSRRAGGVGSRDLYVATRARSTDEFGAVTQLSSLNSVGLDHQPWLSANQLTIYFVSDRSGNVDIWRSTRTAIGSAFAPPEAVSELNTPSEEGGITLSSDELEAILTSNRPGAAGARDLYRAKRASTSEPFSSIEPISELDTTDNEIDPELSADGTELYFASNRQGGVSALYRAARHCPR